VSKIPRFEELDYRDTPLGEVILRRRTMMTLGDLEVYEIMLGSDFLMSSLFTVVEEALSELGLLAAKQAFPDESEKGDLEVVVGGLGLGYTARAALAFREVSHLYVVDYLQPVIEWHEKGLVPLGSELMADPRCQFVHGDFFKLAMKEDESKGFNPEDCQQKFHAILLDIDHSPEHLLNPAHASFYTPSVLKKLADQLYPGGVFALWSDDPPTESFQKSLKEVFDRCETHIVNFENPLLGRYSESTVYVCQVAK